MNNENIMRQNRNQSPKSYEAQTNLFVNISPRSSPSATSPDLQYRIPDEPEGMTLMQFSHLLDFSSDHSLSPPSATNGSNGSNSASPSSSDMSDLGDIISHSLLGFGSLRHNSEQRGGGGGVNALPRSGMSSPRANGHLLFDRPSRFSSPNIEMPNADRTWSCMRTNESNVNANNQALNFQMLNNERSSSSYNRSPITGQNCMSSLLGTAIRNELNDMFKSTMPSCRNHLELMHFYCETCSKPICQQCMLAEHSNHVVSRLTDIIERTTQQAKDIVNVLMKTKEFIIERNNNIHAAMAALEANKHQAKFEVTNSIRFLIMMLEKREEEILEKIEHLYQLKHSSLQSRDDTYRGLLYRVNRASDDLKSAIGNAAIAVDPEDIITKKDTALAETYQVRQSVFSCLDSTEDGYIGFTGIDQQQVNRVITSLGNVVTTSPGTVGDRRRNILSLESRFRQLAPFRAMGQGQAVPGHQLPVVVRVPTGKEPQPSMVIGNRNEEEMLCRPWGVACDRDGHIVVSDRSNNRILVFDQQGTLLRKIGSHGTAPGQFDRPAGIAVDARKRIIVVDKDNHRVQVLTMEGRFLFSFGHKGSQCGQFNYPWDVKLNSAGEMLISDTRNRRIQQFSASGLFLRKFGYETSPHMWKSFDSPRGISFSGNGEVVMTDFNTHQVVIIDAEFVKFRLLGGDEHPIVFSRPQGILVDDEGNYVIADSKNGQVQIYNRRGEFVGKFGKTGDQLGEMDRPSGMAITTEGRLVIVDFGNNRVLVY